MIGVRLIAGAGVVLLVALSGVTRTGSVRAQGPDLGSDAQRQAGQQLYVKYCAQCHGDKGDGGAPVPTDDDSRHVVTARSDNGKVVVRSAN